MYELKQAKTDGLMLKPDGRERISVYLAVLAEFPMAIANMSLTKQAIHIVGQNIIPLKEHVNGRITWNFMSISKAFVKSTARLGWV